MDGSDALAYAQRHFGGLYWAIDAARHVWFRWRVLWPKAGAATRAVPSPA